MLSRREFGKLALASVPAATVLGGSDFFTAFAQGKPNSKIEGVQIGTITYSYRSMPDQSAEATLTLHPRIGDQRRRVDGRADRELRGRSRRRTVAAAAVAAGPAAPAGAGGRGERGAIPAELPPGARKGAWNGTECVIPAPGGGGGGARWRRRTRPRRGDAPNSRRRSRNRPPR